jgi:hypothetical protein
MQAGVHAILPPNGWPIIANGHDALVIGPARYNEPHE